LDGASKLPIAGGDANNGTEDIAGEGDAENDPLKFGWAGIMRAIGADMELGLIVGSARS